MAAVTRKMTLDFGVATKTIPVAGTNDSLTTKGTSQIVGEVTVNQDGNATWSISGRPFYTSNKENNYEWRPVPNALNDLLPIVKLKSGNNDLTTNDINKAFYQNSNGSTVTTLNNARRNIMTSKNAGNGFNSPEFAKTLPGGPNYRPPGNTGGEDQDTPPPAGETPPAEVGGATSQPVDINNVNNVNIEGEAAAVDTGLYVYPLERLDKMDYIEFTSFTYGNRGISEFNWDKRTVTETKEKVLLPIQPSITDNNSVRWNESQSSPVQIAGANISLGAITGGGAGLESKLNEVLASVSKNSAEIQSFVALYMASEAVKTNLLTKMTGSIVNPNLELLFEAPSLRPFTFNFKLSPRSHAEATNVQKIIRFFKKNMAPQTTTSGLFLKTPNVFAIRYVYGETGETHPGINLIKSPCALQACAVDYTPDGSYMTFNDVTEKTKIGSMVSYSLTLQFMELEPVYARDYDKGDEGKAANHNIGY